MDAKPSNCYHFTGSFLMNKQKNRSKSGLLVSKTLVCRLSKIWLRQTLNFHQQLMQAIDLIGAQKGTVFWVSLIKISH